MDKFSNRKNNLNLKLKGVILQEYNDNIIVRSNNENNINVTRRYRKEIFGFSPGDFVSKKGRLMLCVGVGFYLARKELWFLEEMGTGVSCWPGYRTKEFAKDSFVLLT